MPAQKLFGIVKNVSSILGQLEQAGMRVEIGIDFCQYRTLRSAQADRSAPYPMFDVTSSYIDESNGFWVCGFNQEDELIHTQAVRLLDLTGRTLEQHLNTHRHKYITPGTTPDPDLTFYSGPESIKTISGRVCYQGDFWLPSLGLGGPRSQGATMLLSRLLFEMMHLNWEPDYVFALVPKQLAAKGAHLRYGYNHCEPGTWIGPDEQITEEDYLIWMSGKEVSSALSREPASIKRGAQISAVQSSMASIDTKG